MRFGRMSRFPEFTDTSRKRAALRRRQRLDREKLPLFSALIAETQPDEDTVMAQRAERWEIMEEEQRQRRADDWRRARRRLAEVGGNMRPLILAYWNNHRWLPGEPGYLLDLLHSIETGRMVADDSGHLVYAHHRAWLPVEEVRARIAAGRAAVQAGKRMAVAGLVTAGSE